MLIFRGEREREERERDANADALFKSECRSFG